MRVEPEFPNLPEDPVLTYAPDSVRWNAKSSLSANDLSETATSPSAVEWTVSFDHEDKEVDLGAERTAGGMPLRHSTEAESIADAPTIREASTKCDDMAVKGDRHGNARPGAAYRLRKLVARGGMGEVWEARQDSLGRTVAVKRIRADMINQRSPALHQRMIREFHQEALVAAQLDHPNIVPVHDLGLGPNGEPLLAMKLARGEPWDAIIKRDFRELPEPDFLAKHLPILVDVAQAVAFAHSRGIVHRDIKPAQVIVGRFGETLLMDWGLAVFLPEEAEDAGASISLAATDLAGLPTAETASNPAGTPAMMAPEQTESNARNIGPWTDAYLLGGTLYYLLTGTYPHEAESARLSMMRAALGEVEPPEKRAPTREIPRELSNLSMKAMSVKPVDRISSKNLADTLKDFISGTIKKNKAEELIINVRSKMIFISKQINQIENEIEERFLIFFSKHNKNKIRSRIFACITSYSKIFDMLEDILRLWPKNKEVLELKFLGLLEIIKLEIKQGDFLLAKVHLKKLENINNLDDSKKKNIISIRKKLYSKMFLNDLIKSTKQILFIILIFINIIYVFSYLNF